jgi:hypothetical protein
MTDVSSPGVSAKPRARRRLRVVARPELAMALLLIAAAVLLLYKTRGTTAWVDEWLWIVQRRGWSLDGFLRPHNQHLSLVPVALYRVLFATTGVAHSLPYRILMVAAHLGCVSLLFVYARRRVGGWAAVGAAALLLFLGPGWEVLLWPFEIGWIISLGAGLACLLALDRRDRGGDVAAAALLTLSLASSGIGIAVGLGVAVEILAVRRRPRDLWILAAPVVLFGLWWIGYQERPSGAGGSLQGVPRWVADAVAASLAAVTGLGGHSVPDNHVATLLSWGRPLGIAVLVMLAVAVPKLWPVNPRVLTLAVIVVSFSALTALNRAAISLPYASRYLYVGCLFVILIAVELAAGRRLPARVGAVAALAILAAVASNLRVLGDGARYLRDAGTQTRIALGAVDVARGTVSPSFTITGLPGYPFVRVRAGEYFAAARDLGTPAAAPAALGTTTEPLRRMVDTMLIRAERVGLNTNAEPLGAACPVLGPGRAPALRMPLPAAGAWITVPRGTATIAVRRFADHFEPLGVVSAGAPAALRLARDRDARPWQLEVRPSSGEVEICPLH